MLAGYHFYMEPDEPVKGEHFLYCDAVVSSAGREHYLSSFVVLPVFIHTAHLHVTMQWISPWCLSNFTKLLAQDYVTTTGRSIAAARPEISQLQLDGLQQQYV